jgi:hypothetical protein
MTKKFELQVIDEYESLVSPLTKVERIALKQDMMEHGQQVDIICNDKGVILDGHNRYNICLELGLKPKYIIKKFKSTDEERAFVLRNTIFRRNLNDWSKFEHAWKLYYKEPTKVTHCMYCKSSSIKRHGGTQKTRFGKEQRYQCSDCDKHFTLTSIINHEINRVRSYLQNFAAIGIATNTIKLCVQFQTTVTDKRILAQLRNGTTTVNVLRRRIIDKDQMKIVPVRTQRKHSATIKVQDKAQKAISHFEGKLFSKYDLADYLDISAEHTNITK